MGFFKELNKIMGFSDASGLEKRSIGTGKFGALCFGGGTNYTQDKAMLLSTVYRCVNAISDSIAQLPLEPYKIDSKGYKKKLRKHPCYKIINATPNKRMTRYTFIQLLISSMLLRGNAYAYILRNQNGEVEQLIYIPSEYVTIIPPKFIIEPVKYSIVGINGEIEEKDLIHLLNFSYDGVNGISTLSHARNTLGLATDAEQHATNFFQQGAAIGGFIEVPAMMQPKQKEEFKQSWIETMGSKKGATNGVAILESGAHFQPVSISPSDSQLLESRQFDVVSICRFFGVSPIKCFDLSHANYNSSEAANLSFLTDTLQPIMQKIELELERKLFPNEEIDIRFDTSALLRADKAALSSYFRELIQNGVMSINECRKELDLLPVEGGDKNVMQSNMMSLENIVNNIPTNSAIDNPIKEENELDSLQ